MWALPGLGLESVSPALAGGFLTTVPLYLVTRSSNNVTAAFIPELHTFHNKIILLYSPKYQYCIHSLIHLFNQTTTFIE